MKSEHKRRWRGKSRNGRWPWSTLKLSLAVSAAALLMSPSVGATTLPRGEENRSHVRPTAEFPACTDGVKIIGFSDALDNASVDDADIGGLSAISYSGQGSSYFAVTDHQGEADARVFELSIPISEEGLGPVEPLSVTTLTDDSGQPFSGANFDGEGLVAAAGAMLVASEVEPAIRQFSSTGELQATLEVPERFLVAPAGNGVANGTFESLTMGSSGLRFFTATELPLTSDGSAGDGANRIRILEYGGLPLWGYRPMAEYYYLTDPDQRVVDMVALNDTTLLVLEKGVSGAGNTARIFKVSLAGAEDVSSVDSLASSDVEALEKTLLVDIGDCPSPDPGNGQGSVLANYDGLTLGPWSPRGYRSLVLVSDDNFDANEVTRVLVLTVEQSVLR